MTDGPARRGWRAAHLGALGRRFAIGSLVVSFLSIAVLTVVTLLVLDFDFGSAGRERESAYETALVASVRSAYLAVDGWAHADLAPARALAQLEGVGVELIPSKGSPIVVTKPRAGARPVSLSVTDRGREVGRLLVDVPASGLSPTELSLRHNLVNAVAIAASAAALLALSVAVVASRRLVAPIRLLTEAAERFGAGDHSARARVPSAPGELGQLANAFDRMADDLEQEDALRRALVADVAHELRTPVAILRAQLAAVSEGMAALTLETVGSLEEEVDRLGRIVEDLGVLAAADAAGLSLHLAPVDLAAVAANAIERLSHRFVERGVTVVQSLASALVLGDEGRLEQATLNLLSNAEKFSGRGGEVRVAVERRPPSAVLSVSDDGPGIPPEEQELVFERFYRSPATRTLTRGSGVGLAVVAEIVRVHDGSVELDSRPGKGSTFRMVLPLL